jgi:ferredoxin
VKIKTPMEYLMERKIPFLKGGKTSRFLFDSGGWYMFTASRFPVLRSYSWYNRKRNNFRFIPMNEDLKVPESAPLPISILDRFIEEASHRVIITGGCPCRTVCGCENYSSDTGCLFLGDSAVEMPQSLSREVSVEEAKAHAKMAIDSGLVPIIGKVAMDNTVFMVKDRKRLVSVCFCCECCCISRHTRNMKLDDMDAIFKRLDGISLEVTDDCSGCRKCVDACYVGAMSVPYGRAQIGDFCRACGRCVTVCPKDAIKIRIEDPEYIEKAYEQIVAHVKHD